MGAVCAVIYLLTIIIFIPFPFYKDIVAATSGGGNRDVMLDLHEAENGRILHRFPHSKVSQQFFHAYSRSLLFSSSWFFPSSMYLSPISLRLIHRPLLIASVLPLRHALPPNSSNPRHRR